VKDAKTAAPAAGAPPTASGWSVPKNWAPIKATRWRSSGSAWRLKIAASRVARKAEEDHTKIKQAKEWREEKKKTKNEKKKREKAAGAKSGKDGAGDDGSKKTQSRG